MYDAHTVLDIVPDSPDTRAETLDLLKRIEERRERRLVCFYQNHVRGTEEFDRAALQRFRRAMDDLGHVEKVSVLVESPGGDIHAAYQMVRLLRARVKDVEVLISRWAKSAATFFCLGADSIWMADTAEMGPLDAQLTDPKGSVVLSSALNTFKSLEYLRQFSLETLDYIIGYLMEPEPAMDYPYALESATPLVSQIMTPIFQQVSPRQLGEARMQLAVAEEYSRRVMTRYTYSDWAPARIQAVVRRLVWDYPAHSFVIDLDEAQSLGLRAHRLDEETSGLCETLLETVHGCMGIRPVSEDPVEETAALIAVGDTHGNGHTD